MTIGNWFTSVDLAKTMLRDPYKLTIVGALRKNKTDIPQLLDIKSRKPRQTKI